MFDFLKSRKRKKNEQQTDIDRIYGDCINLTKDIANHLNREIAEIEQIRLRLEKQFDIKR